MACAIAFKRKRGQRDLPAPLKRLNRMIASMRARVEHPFAMVEHQFGLAKVRYRGQERNAFDFCMMLTASHIKRRLILTHF